MRGSSDTEHCVVASGGRCDKSRWLRKEARGGEIAFAQGVTADFCFDSTAQMHDLFQLASPCCTNTYIDRPEILSVLVQNHPNPTMGPIINASHISPLSKNPSFNGNTNIAFALAILPTRELFCVPVLAATRAPSLIHLTTTR